jgi:hypothetical protein
MFGMGNDGVGIVGKVAVGKVRPGMVRPVAALLSPGVVVDVTGA